MMKCKIIILCILLVAGCQTSKESIADTQVDSVTTADDANSLGGSLLEKFPLVTWLRKTPVEIGCMFEQIFNVRDSVFNCSYKNYVNKGDPCNDTTAYYEGVAYPSSFVKDLHPLAENIELSFEHGLLRQIDIHFREPILIQELKNTLKLPQNNSAYPDNLMTIMYAHGDEKATRVISLIGFEHQGSADVDCE